MPSQLQSREDRGGHRSPPVLASDAVSYGGRGPRSPAAAGSYGQGLALLEQTPELSFSWRMVSPQPAADEGCYGAAE